MDTPMIETLEDIAKVIYETIKGPGGWPPPEAEGLVYKLAALQAWRLSRVLPQEKSKYRPVDEWELSVRAANSLRNVGIERMEQIQNATLSSLMRIPNIGRGTAMEILEAIRVELASANSNPDS